MASKPPNRPTGGTAVFLLLVLAFVVGALLVWGFSRSPPNRPHPAATANPDVPPAGSTAPAAPATR